MKKIFLTFVLIAGFTAVISAQRPFTARQLFMMVPTEFISGSREVREESLFSAPPTSDILTFTVFDDFLPKSFIGEFKEVEGLGDFRVFRGKGFTLAAIRVQVGDATLEEKTIDDVKFFTMMLEFKGGKWSDVTATALPKVTNEEAHKLLVESTQDQTIKVEDVSVDRQVSKDESALVYYGRVKGSSDATPLKVFKWNGAKFVEPK